MEEYIQDILGNLLLSLEFEFSHIQIDIREDEDGAEEYYCNVETKSEDTARLIGKGGKNLQAIQHLVKLILFKRTDKNTNITVDVDSYRERQKESVIGMTERHITKLRENGKTQSLPPMSPYFRRVVHMHISTSEACKDIATESKGYGDRRHIILNLK
jgi:spoIIIJ-associated protein